MNGRYQNQTDFLNFKGDVPVFDVKILVKYDELENPVLTEISSIDISVFFKRSIAFSILFEFTYSLTVHPKSS